MPTGSGITGASRRIHSGEMSERCIGELSFYARNTVADVSFQVKSILALHDAAPTLWLESVVAEKSGRIHIS
jgi:hypothetical protein